MLQNIVKRCGSDAWSLEKDALVLGASNLLFSDDGDGCLPVTIPRNLNGAAQLTLEEQKLLALQRHILSAL
jgi:hypothetical protein